MRGWSIFITISGRITIDFYNLRERPKEEILPWDHIDIGVSREFLYREYEKAQREEITPNCMKQCSGCGAASFGCGICKQPRRKEAEV